MSHCQNVVNFGETKPQATLALAAAGAAATSAALMPTATNNRNAVTTSTSAANYREQLKERIMSKKTKPEENFYENLTLGLKNTLSNVPRVCDIRCDMRQPCEKAQVVNWEQRHSVYLPEDMKKFYLSTDGFIFQWSYQYAADDTRRVGLIHFPHLIQITLLRENVETSSSTSSTSAAAAAAAAAANNYNGAPTASASTATIVGSSASNFNISGSSINVAMDGSSSSSAMAAATSSASASSSTNLHSHAKDRWGNPTPILTAKTKIFELNNINDVAKVCLVYESTGTSNPKIYLLELNDFRWQFLAESFSEYLRMSIAHLGLPYWELCFASCGLPSWTEQLFLLLAPHLLEDHEPRRTRLINPAPEHPYNVIDPNIFRVKPKGTTKAASAASKLK